MHASRVGAATHVSRIGAGGAEMRRQAAARRSTRRGGVKARGRGRRLGAYRAIDRAEGGTQTRVCGGEAERLTDGRLANERTDGLTDGWADARTDAQRVNTEIKHVLNEYGAGRWAGGTGREVYR